MIEHWTMVAQMKDSIIEQKFEIASVILISNFVANVFYEILLRAEWNQWTKKGKTTFQEKKNI